MKYREWNSGGTLIMSKRFRSDLRSQTITSLPFEPNQLKLQIYYPNKSRVTQCTYRLKACWSYCS